MSLRILAVSSRLWLADVCSAPSGPPPTPDFTCSQSLSGRPVEAAVRSMIGSPSRLSDPIVAIESVVTSGRTSLEISIVTSMRVPTNSTPVTLPTSLPLRRTTDPLFIPCTLSNCVLSGYRCQKNPPWPPTATTSTVAMSTATTPTMPSFSSDQTTKRVRGITAPLQTLSTQEGAQVLVRGLPQRVGGPLKGDLAILQHEKHDLRAPVRARLDELDAAVVGHRLMVRDIKR